MCGKFRISGEDLFTADLRAKSAAGTDLKVFRLGNRTADGKSVYMTVDDTPAEADAFFPDYSDWQKAWEEVHEKDEKHAFNYAFVDYVRP